MFLSNTFYVVLAIVSSASAFPALRSQDVDFSTSVAEKLNGPPTGWVQDDSIIVDKDAATITLRINLVRQGVDKFQDMAMNVSFDTLNIIQNLFHSISRDNHN